MKSYKVVIWKLSVNRSAKKPTYLVRWSVDGEAIHESHTTKALADRFRAELLRAADKGEPFDTVTGLPDSLRGGRAALSLLGPRAGMGSGRTDRDPAHRGEAVDRLR
ncbi:hypothetical protein [Streptomyces sp. I6]|uniref:hypothetical protein n=1 Tax=Streptomyces sp. I6 TaxID=2483113 RepID=UPI002880825D|nr:hypothetical protein [Streptomyces sp. I6]